MLNISRHWQPRLSTGLTSRFLSCIAPGTYAARSRHASQHQPASRAFQPSSRKMQVLQADEQSFFWGRPVHPSPVEVVEVPGLSPESADYAATAVAKSSSVAIGIAADLSAVEAVAAAGHSGSSSRSTPQPRVASVPSARFHSIVAAVMVSDLLQELEEALEEGGGGSGGGGLITAAGADAGMAKGDTECSFEVLPPLLLPPRIVEVALAKTAGWALDPAACAGTDPEAMWQTVELLQRSLYLSRLEGYSLDDVASVLWSLANVLGEYGCWGRTASTTNRGTAPALAVTADTVLEAVHSWLCRSGTVAALKEGPEAGKFSVLASLLWGYAALMRVAATCSDDGGGGTSSQPGQAVASDVEGRGGGRNGRSRILGDEAHGAAAAAAAATAAATSGGDYHCGSNSSRSSRSRHQRQEDALSAGPGLDALACRAAELIRAYGSSEPVAAVELADVAWALSVIGRRSPATALLSEAMAHEIYRQLSNRSSLHTPFEPADLVKVVRAYADLGLAARDGSVPRMLDAVGGHVAQRIRGRHVGAITRPMDCAELLKAFADSGHNSVVVPELLQALALQICREVATHNIAAPRVRDGDDGLVNVISTSTVISSSTNSRTSGSTMTSTISTSSSASASKGIVAAQFRQKLLVPLWEQRLSRLQHLTPVQLRQLEEEQGRQNYWHWSDFLEARLVISTLSSYIRMGYYPGVNLMDSLLLAVQPQLLYMVPGEVSELLELLAAARHIPGSQTLDLLALAALRHPTDDKRNQVAATAAAAAVAPAAVVVEDGQQQHQQGSSWHATSPAAAAAAGDLPAGHGSNSSQPAAGSPLQQLASLWSLVMLGWRPEPGEVEQVLCPVLLDDSLHLGVQDAGRVMSLLCVLPRSELTIQRLGLAAVKLRGALAAAGASSSSAKNVRQLHPTLLSTGVAMALLGAEGWEMAEQVLPMAHFRLVEEELRRVLLNPYDGVDESYLTEATQGLYDIDGSCTAGVTPVLVPVDALRRLAVTGSSDNGRATEATVAGGHTQECGVLADEAEDGMGVDDGTCTGPAAEVISYAPLMFNPLAVRVLPQQGTKAEEVGNRMLKVEEEAMRTAEIMAGQAAQQSGVPAAAVITDGLQPSRVGMLLYICSSAECGSNAPDETLWGWVRVRQVLFEACMESVKVVLLPEGKMRKLKGRRADVRSYLQRAISNTLR